MYCCRSLCHRLKLQSAAVTLAFSLWGACCTKLSHWSSWSPQQCPLGIMWHCDASQPVDQWGTGSDLKLNKNSICQRWCPDSKGYLIPVLEAGRVRGGGSGWGSRGSSANLSQLHAWLAMLTLTLTRQRGDTSWPAGARVYEHVHAHAHAGIDSHSHVHTCIYSLCQCSVAATAKIPHLCTPEYFKNIF